MPKSFGLIAGLLAWVVAGCIGTRPSREAVGVFKNKDGRRVLLDPKGYIYELQATTRGSAFIGIASAERKNPRKMFVTTASGGAQPWMGATLKFDPQFTRFDLFEYETQTEPTKPPKDTFERVQ